MHGPEGVRFYTRLKTVTLALADRHPRRRRVHDADDGLIEGNRRPRIDVGSIGYLTDADTGSARGASSARSARAERTLAVGRGRSLGGRRVERAGRAEPTGGPSAPGGRARRGGRSVRAGRAHPGVERAGGRSVRAGRARPGVERAGGRSARARGETAGRHDGLADEIACLVSPPAPQGPGSIPPFGAATRPTPSAVRPGPVRVAARRRLAGPQEPREEARRFRGFVGPGYRHSRTGCRRGHTSAGGVPVRPFAASLLRAPGPRG